jgi:hypothetical protein
MPRGRRSAENGNSKWSPRGFLRLIFHCRNDTCASSSPWWLQNKSIVFILSEHVAKYEYMPYWWSLVNIVSFPMMNCCVLRDLQGPNISRSATIDEELPPCQDLLRSMSTILTLTWAASLFSIIHTVVWRGKCVISKWKMNRKKPLVGHFEFPFSAELLPYGMSLYFNILIAYTNNSTYFVATMKL